MKHIRNTIIPILIIGASVMAQDLTPIELPPPDSTGGAPLMQTLNDRHSTREYRTDTLPHDVLSNLLWAAAGINRPESAKRTAPSAINWQEISVYVARPDGLYFYDGPSHTLQPILPNDIRAETGTQDFVADAPLNLVYVADYSKMGDRPAETKARYAAADAAFMAQNVYLFAASEGLGTVVRGSVDRDTLAKTMRLPADHHVVWAQTVGYPKE